MEINTDSQYKQVCKYFIKGCIKGNKCEYLHLDIRQHKKTKWIKSNANLQNNYPRTFFVKDINRRDNKCKYICTRKLLCISQVHHWNCLEHKETIIEKNMSKNLECVICTEKIKKFGILEKCNHIFCMYCIMKWRNSYINKQTSKLCPLCRVRSHIVISCNRFITDPKRKLLFIKMYKTGMKKINCKYFIKQKCPFKDNCMFSHEKCKLLP